MSKNLLRAPLIKSAVFLTVLTIIIYLTATSHEGSVWNALGTIFFAVFKVAQLSVGLLLALILCLAVLIGIFLGCVAMVSTESATRMYNQLREVFAEKLAFIKDFIPREEESKKGSEVNLAQLQTALQGEFAAQLESSLQPLRARIDQVESDDRPAILTDRLQLQEVKIDVLEEKHDKGNEKYQALHEQLVETAQQIEGLSFDQGISELGDRLTSLENKKNEIDSLYASLAQKVDSLQQDIESLKKVETKSAQKVASSETGDESEHRLFSYIENSKERGKIARLVAEGVQNELTNAQLTELLTSKTAKPTAKVISAHPSLTKDYIRHVRKKS